MILAIECVDRDISSGQKTYLAVWLPWKLAHLLDAGSLMHSEHSEQFQLGKLSAWQLDPEVSNTAVLVLKQFGAHFLQQMDFKKLFWIECKRTSSVL